MRATAKALLFLLGVLTGVVWHSLPQAATHAPPRPIVYKADGTTNVLCLLQRRHTVRVRKSTFGTCVVAIDGLKETKRSCWLYYIDGQIAPDTADKVIPKKGQVVAWQYKTYRPAKSH